MKNEIEIWENIDENGFYQISNLGNIKSSDRIIADGRHRKERILKQFIGRDGYCKIYLHALFKNYHAHVLVAIAFIQNPYNKPFINHKNGIKTDNRAVNLEWCTASENMIHARDTGLWKIPKGENNKLFGKNNNHLSKKIYQLDIHTNNVIKQWDSLHDIQRQHGWDIRPISLCALGKGRRKTAHGFKWAYKI